MHLKYTVKNSGLSKGRTPGQHSRQGKLGSMNKKKNNKTNKKVTSQYLSQWPNDLLAFDSLILFAKAKKEKKSSEIQ